MNDDVIAAVPYVLYIALGIYFARRWVVEPPLALKKYPRALRVGTLILGSWLGALLAADTAYNIGFVLNDGIVYVDGGKAAFELLHDRGRNLAATLVLGWISGFLFWSAASLIPKRRQNKPVERSGASG